MYLLAAQERIPILQQMVLQYPHYRNSVSSVAGLSGLSNKGPQSSFIPRGRCLNELSRTGRTVSGIEKLFHIGRKRTAAPRAHPSQVARLLQLVVSLHRYMEAVAHLISAAPILTWGVKRGITLLELTA